MISSRRSFVRDSSLLGAAAMLGPSETRNLAMGEAPWTLAAAGRQNGILVGSAVNVAALRKFGAYADLIRMQCSIMVAENAMKFGLLRPTKDTYFFDEADFLVDFAQQHGLMMRGHNFVWHRQLPGWFDAYATTANAAKVLSDHIERVGGRYAGRIHSWDVCNEVIEVNDGQPAGLRNTPWFKVLGPEYIDLAYRAARRADPHALLCYNDYGIESEGPAPAAKRKAVLSLLRGMQDRGVPIDAMGIQAHISAGNREEFGRGLTDFMKQVERMGLKLLITEMDVNDRALPAPTTSRDEAVALRYRSLLDTVLSNRQVIAVLTWGLTDKYTWLNSESSRPDHLPERCLPFDADLRPVKAFHAEVQALLQAPPRQTIVGRLLAQSAH